MTAESYRLSAADVQPFRSAVTVLGDGAREALAQGAAGSVIAVFRRSFYVETTHGIACLGAPSLGRGPLNALLDLPPGIDWPASGLREGDAIQVADATVLAGQRLAIDIAGAEAWRPVATEEIWDRQALARGLEALAATAAQRMPADGLGYLIPALCAGGGTLLHHHSSADPLRCIATPAAMAFAGWLSDTMRHAATELPNAAACLIGLGPGLTPSGDDFVGGAMIALRSLGRPDMAMQLAAWSQPRLAATVRISAAHLVWAARGQGAAALHDILTILKAADRCGLGAGLDADEIYREALTGIDKVSYQ